MIAAVFARSYLRSFLLLVVLGPVVLYGLLHFSPAFGAGAADFLRGIIGNEGVAVLESLVFRAEDEARQAQYELGLGEAAAPWSVEPVATDVRPTATATVWPTATPVAVAHMSEISWQATVIPTMAAEEMVVEAAPLTTATPLATATPLPSPTATPWQPAPVRPLGSLEGEGVWQPYIWDADGAVVAYRTFVQPDPERPFAVVGVVAFDLRQTKLNFVLGSEEPSVAGGERGNGRMAAEDMTAGRLLATFNGGFKATHGQYGAMSNGIMPLPAIEGLGTVALYEDGSILIGEWGQDVMPSARMVAWRQNAPLVVQSGQVTAAAERNSIVDWSGSIDGAVVTWRSGLGLSSDRQVLYYLAGPSLNMPALGRAMVAAGVYQGMLLDINEYWVHFTAIRAGEEGLTAEGLFAEEMATHADRFLRQSARDFFYVTLE
jgi:hypothetical protein